MSAQDAVSSLIDEWQQLRAEMRAIEVAEHPPITDKYGRVWTWKDRDLYVHDQLAFTADMVRSERVGLPKAMLRDSPNYRLCGICTQSW